MNIKSSHAFVWPTKNLLQYSLSFLNWKWLRDIFRICLPKVPNLKSNITNVVYINWLIPADRVKHLLPSPLKLDTHNDLTWLSVLIFKHGNFGPRWLGPLRKLFPSPIQSNWRLYLNPGPDSVYFVKSAINNSFYATTSRLFSDGLPSHYPLKMKHKKLGNSFHSVIDPGAGNAPDMNSEVKLDHTKSKDWDAWLNYLIQQNNALSVLESGENIIRSKIRIPVDLNSVLPLTVDKFESRYLDPYIDGIKPFAFFIPEIDFEYLGEEMINVSPETHRPYPHPKSPWINFQRWNKLCFIHWEVSQDRLRELVPKELELDSYNGKFYIGIVPFEMDKVSLRGTPAIPFYSTFPELNIRTYVKFKGKQGVYFLSLDATRRFFVWGGKTFFHLPYHASKMNIDKKDSIDYSMSRISDNGKTFFSAQYKPIGNSYQAKKGSMEEFLTERYCLFVVKDGRVGTCEIDHKQWVLYNADLKIEKNTLLDNLTFKTQGDPLIHFSESIDVKVWPLKFQRGS